MFENTIFRFLGIYILRILALCIPFVLSSCFEENLLPEDVEYRKDENGTEILFEIEAEQPFGSPKRAYVSEKHPNGEPHFKIGFSHGLKDGPFHFWQDNGLKLLSGSFKKGKRQGLFTAYGKTGELVYEKNYLNGELDGNFTLYYPASNSDVIRYFEKLSEDGLKPEELPVKSQVRLKVRFSEGNPSGPYKAYFHPQGKNLSLSELIREEGYFDENGSLEMEQIKYFPRTFGLVVRLPDNSRLETLHDPSPDGLSRAMDEATKAIQAIPAYRNPDQLPALVYTVDDRGNEIVPIWSSHIVRLGIRNMDGFMLPDTFEANFEIYSQTVRPAAEDVLLALDVSNDPNLPIYEKRGAAVEVVGLDQNGVIIDVLWSSSVTSDIIPLEERIFAKRIKVRRKWNHGFSNHADWFLNDGSTLNLRGNNQLVEFGIFR